MLFELSKGISNIHNNICENIRVYNKIIKIRTILGTEVIISNEIKLIMFYIVRKALLIESPTPSILVRSRNAPCVVLGLRVVDILYPIANGQRELIIGDRQSGKSTIWLCSVISQKIRNTGTICKRKLFSSICSVGSRCSSILRFIKMIERSDSRNYCSFIITPITDAMGAQFIGHLTGTSIAEAIRNSGSLFQAAYDDLSKHAVAYRQLCLFLRKPAGREAYPSDVFYLHARLLERSCNLGFLGYFGALMSLPVIETLNNDLSAYIATNVISITDGQIYLDLTLFGIGQCPAVSTEKSVSRVGAKSMDATGRASAFSIYRLIGAVKQEMDNSAKTDSFALRWNRYQKLLLWIVQRSSQSKQLSTIGNLAIHIGCLDSIAMSGLGILLLLAAEFALYHMNNNIALTDRLWHRGNNTVLDIIGNTTKYILMFNQSIRVITTTCFFLSCTIAAVSSVKTLVARTTMQILSSATSFLTFTKVYSKNNEQGNFKILVNFK